MDDDKKFRELLRYLSKKYHLKNINAAELEADLIRLTGKKLKPLFNQYLRTTLVPVLEYQFSEKSFSYRWSDVVSDYEVPVKVNFGRGEKWISPKTTWKKIPLKKGESASTFAIAESLYVKSQEIK
jgi:hypothetical protein